MSNFVKPKLRIGLLLDSFNVMKWQKKVIEEVHNSNYADLDLLILNNTFNERKSFYVKYFDWRRKVYSIFDKIDEKFHRQSENAFELFNIESFLSEVPRIYVEPKKTKYSDYFKDEDIQSLNKKNLDVVIRFGFRILRGEILKIAKNGVWSYHHGDNRVNRGGPPGFWEVVYKWPYTGSVLQILNEDLDGGQVIYKSWSTTDLTSPSRNRNNMFMKSASFIPRKLEELHKKLEKINSEHDPEMNFEHELLEHLRNKFPKEYKLTIEAKKKDEPDENPEDITPGRIGEYMGNRVDEFIDE